VCGDSLLLHGGMQFSDCVLVVLRHVALYWPRVQGDVKCSRSGRVEEQENQKV
jgi:hypothetical protein